MIKHKLTTHRWHNGRLERHDFWFPDFHSAKAQAEVIICDFFKIFDEFGILIFSGGGGSPDYA